ncbi:MAG: GAF domain-containing protein, partial [Flavobacteriales bacterium]|nr:GAF domain-containing protein [Flavobacteriales bacterium]
MIEQANFSLQKVINKLLELTTKESDINTFLVKSLEVIIDEVRLLGFSDKGIIFLKRNNEFMKVIAHKNIDTSVLQQCGHVRKKDCVCGKALCSITHQFKNSVEKVQNNKVIFTENNICSFPINYKDNCYGVLTLYLEDEAYYYETTVNEITSICNTIGLVIHEKRMQRYADFVKNKLDVSYGNQYFKNLANFFVEEFKMKYCFIGTYNQSLEEISSIVFMEKDKQLENIVCG